LSFTDTKGNPKKSIYTTSMPLSGCSKPIDEFYKYLGTLPETAQIQTFDSSRLFKSGSDQCVQGDKILPYLTGIVIPQPVSTYVTTLFASSCVHLGNNFSASCNFSLPSVPMEAWAYQDAESVKSNQTIAPTSTVAVTTSPPTSSASRYNSLLVVLVSCSVLLGFLTL